MAGKIISKILYVSIIILYFVSLLFSFSSSLSKTYAAPIPPPCSRQGGPCNTVAGSSCCTGFTCSNNTCVVGQGGGGGGNGNGGNVGNPCPVNDPNPCGSTVPYNGQPFQCPAQLTCVVTIFPRVISAAFQIITSVIVIVVILAGIKFLRSGGDAKQVEGAWKIVTYAIIGFVIVFGSYFIINIIGAVTGVHCIQLLFGFTNCQ